VYLSVSRVSKISTSIQVEVNGTRKSNYRRERIDIDESLGSIQSVHGCRNERSQREQIRLERMVKLTVSTIARILRSMLMERRKEEVASETRSLEDRREMWRGERNLRRSQSHDSLVTESSSGTESSPWQYLYCTIADGLQVLGNSCMLRYKKVRSWTITETGLSHVHVNI
jgi:hypothetical protein